MDACGALDDARAMLLRQRSGGARGAFADGRARAPKVAHVRGIGARPGSTPGVSLLERRRDIGAKAMAAAAAAAAVRAQFELDGAEGAWADDGGSAAADGVGDGGDGDVDRGDVDGVDGEALEGRAQGAGQGDGGGGASGDRDGDASRGSVSGRLLIVEGGVVRRHVTSSAVTDATVRSMRAACLHLEVGRDDVPHKDESLSSPREK